MSTTATCPPDAAVCDSSPQPQGKTCDLCGGADFELVSSLDRHGEELQTGVCTQCGLVAHMDIPTEAELHQFYSEDYRQDYHGELTPSHRRVMRAWNNGRRIFGQLQPHLTPGQRLLEVGAGIGCTVKVFELNGWQASGIDPNVGFLNYSREHLHSPITVGNLYDLPKQVTYDVVLLIHVIEHFRSPKAALQHIRRLLPTGGKFYVECPNLAAPFATQPRLFHFAHIHNFTPQTLQWMAELCGFRLVSSFGSELDPNLQMLFEAAEPQAVDFSGGLQATQEALDRYNSLTYHLRPSYMASRIRKVCSYLWEHLHANSFVAGIEKQCSARPIQETREPLRRAA
jgi:ubiquinone/menaquinone biosynthesis C-methylase UbiE